MMNMIEEREAMFQGALSVFSTEMEDLCQKNLTQQDSKI